MTKSYKGKLRGRVVSRNGHVEVGSLPRWPADRTSYWLNSPNGRSEYTHQLFRFPAKFHPPIVRWALGNYGRKGSVLLDPCTGSATSQVEALVRGMSSVGIDIDPLACLIATVKTTPIDPKRLESGLKKIQDILSPFVKLHADREARKGSDISSARYEREIRGLQVPPIPNIFHWFRRYVIVDLARIIWAVDFTELQADERQFFRACVAAVVRAVSNADPAPVSGLEVTTIQAVINQRRIIRVFVQFFAKVKFAIGGMRRLWTCCQPEKNRAAAKVVKGDILELNAVLDDSLRPDDGFPLVVTSTPYCQAVEYSRRHKLEMYWMGFIDSAAQQIELAHTYVGRKVVRASDWNDQTSLGITGLDSRLKMITERDPARARAVRHYFYSMSKFFQSLAENMKRTGTFVCVIGNSKCCDVEIPTADIFADIAEDSFALERRFSYAVRNHYMQYGLWNGDGIKQEHVLIFKPR